MRPLHAGLAALAAVRVEPIEQPYEGIVLFDLEFEDGPRRIAVDYWDATHVNTQCAARVDFYFKMQCLSGGYPGISNVLPGGYVSSSPMLYRHWCRLRRLRQATQPTADVFARLGLRFSAEMRRRALDLVAADDRLSFRGGSRATAKSWYLREMARARVCLDLPGGGPFCYRLVEGLAMGCCMIGPRHATKLQADLQPGVHVVHCADDLSDLADVCVRYSNDPGARAAIGREAARYFDDHLQPASLARYYIAAVCGSG